MSSATFSFKLLLLDFILRVIAYLIVILAEIMFLRKPFMRLISIARNGWGILSLVPCVPELGSGAYHAERTDYGYQCFY